MVRLPVPKPERVQNLIKTRGDSLLVSNRWRPVKSYRQLCQKNDGVFTQSETGTSPYASNLSTNALLVFGLP